MYISESFIWTYVYLTSRANMIYWPGTRELSHYWPNCFVGLPIEFLAARVSSKTFLTVPCSLEGTLYFGIVCDKNQDDEINFESSGQFSVKLKL